MVMNDGPAVTTREPGLTCEGCRWHYRRKQIRPHDKADAHFCMIRRRKNSFIGLDARTPLWCPLVNIAASSGIALQMSGAEVASDHRRDTSHDARG